MSVFKRVSQKGRVDKLTNGKISTDSLLDEFRAKIQLAEYEHKAIFEKNEQEKKTNFKLLGSERHKNTIRLKSMYVSSPQSLVNVPDAHNISYAFENKQRDDKLCVIRKKMPVAIEIQDGKVCEAIRKYNLKYHEREQKEANIKQLEEEIQLINKVEERRKQEEMNSEEAQKIRLLENRVEKLKIKLNSAKLIARYYSQIADNLKDDTQNFPWKLDELEAEVMEHKKALDEAIKVNQDANSLVEKSIQSTKDFHDEYFENKKNRDKLIGNTRREVDKARREIKGSSYDKPKTTKMGQPGLINPYQEIIVKEADESQSLQLKYETQRKKRLEYETMASFLKNACKVSSKEEILPAITQQHEVQRALKLQIQNLEDQKEVLEMEKKGVNKEYKHLKYFGEKKISDGMRLIELENTELKEVRDKLEKVISEIKHKKHLLGEMEMATTNFFHLLQKYKIDVRASQLMTEDLGQNLTILTDKLEALYKQIETSGKVVDFLENHDFLDYMEDTLPKMNTRVEIRGEEEEADVFDDEHTEKRSSSVMGREDIKKASQRIVERNQGKTRRKKK